MAVRTGRRSASHESIYGRRVRSSDVILTGVIYGCAAFSILLLAGIMGYVFVRGIPHVTWSFLSTASSATKGTFGILGNIINTLYIVTITLLIATPLGIGSAVYLNEYARPGKAVRLIEFTTETLSGIPSIIFGLFGMVFFGNTLGLGYSILTGALTLTLMILPLITRTTQEALKTVPDSYRHGALGIGATKWYMIRTIILPSSVDGIVTGCILSIGRIVGESAALLFTAGVGTVVANNIFSAFTRSGGTLSVALYMYVSERGEFDVGFAIAAILMLLVLCINGAAKLVEKKLRRKTK